MIQLIANILASKCPSCREGKMWNHSPYKLSKMTAMNKRCPNCGANLEPEPSFYTGAMYVGYAFSVAIVLGVFIAFNILYEDPSVNMMSLWVLIIVLIFAPLNLRFSRNIWAHTFIKHKEK